MFHNDNGGCVIKYNFTIKNYRCFTDARPARFSISRGMTCFIGVNNSGKSALLKMFQELRNLWHVAANYDGSGGANIGAMQSYHVFDQQEIFCDRNNRNLAIEIEVVGAPEVTDTGAINVTRVVLVGSRDYVEAHNNVQWSIDYYVGKELVSQKAQFSKSGAAGKGDEFFLAGLGSYSVALLRELFGILFASFYVGPFRNAITVGSGAHFDLAVGEAFIGIWNDWQNGPNKRHNRAITTVTENIRRVMGFERLSITASTQSKTLQLNIDDRPYKLNEVGSGLAQLIVVFGNALIRSPSIIFIDEPELNLHPSLQLEFLTNLASYASYGVIFATHSIGLARSSAERIYTVSSGGVGAEVELYEKNVSPVEMLGELSFSTFRELGAEKILLVEGTTDVKVFQQFLRKAKKDNRVVVLPLGGNSLANGNVEHELSELRRVTDVVAVIVDSEREIEGGEPLEARTAFVELCRRLKFEILLTERRATENYFDDEAVKNALGSGFTALGHFERLSDSQNGWSKADNWRIAMEVDWECLRKTDVGKFIDAL
ncbi:AAA family ATPase [Burkholderia seminalis]|uniref:AAA family ATPase n=2 Tax=Burkholderia seminalis TaxID=488731 RepID=A0A8A8CQK5_9BURK|nr:AAA family ATPase [Burkholderia seminalis]